MRRLDVTAGSPAGRLLVSVSIVRVLLAQAVRQGEAGSVVTGAEMVRSAYVGVVEGIAPR